MGPWRPRSPSGAGCSGSGPWRPLLEDPGAEIERAPAGDVALERVEHRVEQPVAELVAGEDREGGHAFVDPEPGLVALLGEGGRGLAPLRREIEGGARWTQPARFHFPGDDLFAPTTRAVGLPIGNLTSQHFANRFLSPVDHRAKDRLRIRPYLRYMDDMLLFDDDAGRLRAFGHALEEACWGCGSGCTRGRYSLRGRRSGGWGSASCPGSCA
jgi:hypothetical protein